MFNFAESAEMFSTNIAKASCKLTQIGHVLIRVVSRCQLKDTHASNGIRMMSWILILC